MTLAAGIRVGHFEVVAPIGAGGMGEVYRARDSRLGRDVAIKVLPESYSRDRDRLRRFEQEARAAAALNHPNILAVYDVGTHDEAPYIVSELLDGATIREQLKTGPIRRAVDVAVGIAQGLGAAHAKGIAHRDLKPENVFLTADGRVKILDFGLAKLTGTSSEGGENTTTLAGTQPGTLLGTMGYMAPEQLRGEPADHRADIFSFGALLYEMLSGRRAFPAPTTADSVAAILGSDPPSLSSGDRAVPPALARIVDRCLEKNPASRFQSASDLAFALATLSSPSGIAEAAAAIRPNALRTWLPWALLGVAVGAALAVAGLWSIRPPSSDVPLVKSTILPPPGTSIRDRSGVPARRLGISPDGQRLAFTAAGRDGVIWLWVRRLDSLAAERLEGTEGAVYPFWSPDNRYLGFFSEDGKRRSRLMKVDLSGGAPTFLCELPGTNSTGGTWNDDGVILFGVFNTPVGEILRVSAAGGTPVPATKIDPATGENRHYSPYFLPDGRHFLYLAVGVTGGFETQPNGLYVGSLDTTDRTQVMPEGSTAKYANGHLLFVRGSRLFAQPFDVSSLTLSGDAVPIVEQLFVSGPTGAAGGFTVSNNGYLAFQGGSFPPSQLTWFNRKGDLLGLVGEPGFDGDIALSPDDSRVVVRSVPPDQPLGGTGDLWTYDGNVRRRLTSDPASEGGAVWSPDGKQIVFTSNRSQGTGLYLKPSTELDKEQQLVPGSDTDTPLSWSRDGFILYSSGPETQRDLFVLPASGDRKPRPFANGPFSETSGSFSPDGKWVVHVSNENARPEVYVAPFPGPGEKTPVSTSGGRSTRWRGNEIFYVNLRNEVMVAQVTPQDGRVRVADPSVLFRIRPRSLFGRFYDVSLDGQRILVNQLVETADQPVTLVQSWMALLAK